MDKLKICLNFLLRYILGKNIFRRHNMFIPDRDVVEGRVGEIERELWRIQRRWGKVTTPPPFPFDIEQKLKEKSNENKVK